jgi:hypothetical protein
MSDKEAQENEPEQEHRHPSFQESAKKFKPGPVAPPESEADRPDMNGTTAPGTATAAHAERFTDDLPQSGMSDGAPGQLTQMPGE